MTAPLVVVFKREPDAMEEMVRFVVEAFVEVIAVVEAFGNVDAAVAVEVMVPLEAIVVVAVPPTASWFAVNTEAKSDVPVAAVQVSPPLKAMLVVVALPMNGYAKRFAEVR